MWQGGPLQRGTILPPALPWESAAELDVFSWRVLLAVCIALLLAGLAAGLRLLWQGRPRPFVRRLERPALARSLASAEAGLIGQYEIDDWLPGVTVRKRLTLRLPEETSTPASLALMLRVWRGNWAQREILGVDVHSSDRQLLGPDQVVIGSVAVPGPAPVSAGWRPLEARFGETLALSGYSMPEEAVAGSTLALALDWQALAAPGVDYTQFLHFFAEGDDSFVAGFDEPPFGARFPTSDWPAGHALRDEWQVPLPPELTPGDYQLFFGLYDARTLERLPLQVTGEDMQDALLPLGRLRVVAGG